MSRARPCWRRRLCAATNYASFAGDAFNEVRDTEVWAHADEFETSLYLHLAADRVRMEHAGRGDDVMGKYVSSDSVSKYPVRFSDYWGRWTKVGIHGDATTPTREKGEAIYEAAVNGLVEFVDEWKAWPLPERSDQHEHPVQRQIRW